MNWYYALNGQQNGPVPEQELTRLVATGNINAGTLIWRDGMADWQQLGTAFPAALGAAAADVPQIGGFALPEAQKDVVVQQLREGVTLGVPGSVEYAGFWIRLVARFLDHLIMSAVSFVLMIPFSDSLAKFQPQQGHPPTTQEIAEILAPLGIFTLIFFAVDIFYRVFMVVKYGATWGKMAVGIKIVSEDGGKVSTGRAIGRYFAYWLSQLTIYIGCVIAAFDSEKRALHDHVCSTRVIKTH